MNWFEWLKMLIIFLGGVGIAWLFKTWADPLRGLKRFLGTEMGKALAAAVVIIVEALWSELDGAGQFQRACEILSRILADWGMELPPAEIAKLIQESYEAMKKIFGDHWAALKLNLGGGAIS